ncbi:hypothetical protein DYBT9275_02027 [Dyadobacter sp. CECT 9275]|uniref:Enzyme of heme biosynthesis n=1 Tax=Dyadobacter helix TaxID=2822344 RepID=A0A916N5J6_9BACT|nr:tetratricopeptide repeat protein [Dyadobacter sp. CECT 9275]CAG4998573.1 hypothetical protein DYBT9275_02027 [Dyadobacter sp. CECT 9275]
MKNNLLENLLTFYEEDPGDPFNIYALALEYLKFDLSRSEALFSRLLKDFPEYLPTYYHAASFYSEQHHTALAEEIYKKGITLALEQKNVKAHQELTRAFRNFLDEQED